MSLTEIDLRQIEKRKSHVGVAKSCLWEIYGTFVKGIKL